MTKLLPLSFLFSKAPFYRGLKVACLALSLTALGACSGQPGPDKTVAGAVLGAGWGAGAGAIVGNQVGTDSGSAIAVGSGMGLVAGAMSGYSQDAVEDEQIKVSDDLAALKIQTTATRNELQAVQDKLDRSIALGTPSTIYKVYFGEDETELRAGVTAELEDLANTIKRSLRAYKIVVAGHNDDAGTPEYCQRIAEARARAVSSFLSAHGISVDQIEIKSYGSTRPVASNATPEGRQLNRRVEVIVKR